MSIMENDYIQNMIQQVEYIAKHNMFIGQIFNSKKELLEYFGLNISSGSLRKRWLDIISQIITFEPLFKGSQKLRVININIDDHILVNNGNTRRGSYNYPCGVAFATFFLNQLDKQNEFNNYFFTNSFLLKTGMINMIYHLDDQFLKNVYDSVNKKDGFVGMHYEYEHTKYILYTIYDLNRKLMDSGLNYLKKNNTIQYKVANMKYTITGIDSLSDVEMDDYLTLMKQEEEKILEKKSIKSIKSIYDKIEIQRNVNTILFKTKGFRVYKINHVKTNLENLDCFAKLYNIQLIQEHMIVMKDILYSQLKKKIYQRKNSDILLSLLNRILDVSSFSNEAWFKENKHSLSSWCFSPDNAAKIAPEPHK